MIETSEKEIVEFLKESNAIEDVFDDDSLTQAKIAWMFLMSQDVLTVEVVLKTHEALMLNQPLQPDEKGHFRNCEVRVGHNDGLNHVLIAPEIQQWVFKTMRAHPKVDAKELHIRYEKIHPFVDGNGRTGRMFMNWTRIKRNNEPILTITRDERFEYYKWFK